MKGSERTVFLKKLENTFAEYDVETLITSENDTEVLKLGVDGMGRNGDGAVLLELFFDTVNSEGFEERELDYLRIYCTFDVKVNTDHYDDLIFALNNLNFVTYLGSFQALKSEKTLYFKYTLPVLKSDMDAADEENRVTSVIDWILNMADEAYDSLIELACLEGKGQDTETETSAVDSAAKPQTP